MGEIHTNIPYVLELIGMEDFVENRIDTGWLDGLIAQKMQLQPPSSTDVVICGAMLKAYLAMQVPSWTRRSLAHSLG